MAIFVLDSRFPHQISLFILKSPFSQTWEKGLGGMRENLQNQQKTISSKNGRNWIRTSDLYDVNVAL